MQDLDTPHSTLTIDSNFLPVFQVEHEQKTDSLLTATPQKRVKNWLNIIFLTSLPLVTVLWLSIYTYHFGVTKADIVLFLFMYFISGFSITFGYHRYFAHRSFELNKVIQFFVLLASTASLEASVLCWSADHRRHHRFVDREQDPYNSTKGFWWSHIAWIFFKAPGDKELSHARFDNVADLKKNKLVLWQHRYYLPIAIFMSFGLPTLIGYCYGRPVAGFLWGGALRLLMVHHCTFLINSACHIFGTRPYSTKNTARDNWFLALLTFGEGYHNFHHAFPSDYRNGIRWYHWDPSKWMIKGLSLVKLSRDLNKTSDEKISAVRAKNLS